MKQSYNTALYMRLSRDDENYGDSVSIETQRTILQQYAKDNELHVVGEYMVGYYLEYVFPDKQVRYIAVSENEDSKKGLSDFVPFKNLFNEWFAKDTSRKVKTALHAKFAAGERIFTYAPLGYIRHPEIKNAIMIDEETSWIIEKIFDLAFHGAGAAKITKEHGEFVKKGAFVMTAVYHPAALLRDASKKEDMFRDMKKIKAYLDGMEKEA